MQKLPNRCHIDCRWFLKNHRHELAAMIQFHFWTNCYRPHRDHEPFLILETNDQLTLICVKSKNFCSCRSVILTNFWSSAISRKQQRHLLMYTSSWKSSSLFSSIVEQWDLKKLKYECYLDFFLFWWQTSERSHLISKRVFLFSKHIQVFVINFGKTLFAK